MKHNNRLGALRNLRETLKNLNRYTYVDPTTGKTHQFRFHPGEPGYCWYLDSETYWVVFGVLSLIAWVVLLIRA